MKTSVLFTLAGTVCCLATVASAQVTTGRHAPAKHTGGHEGVGFVDNCASAPTVGVGTYSFDTSAASNDYVGGTCGLSTNASDVWVRFVAPNDGLVTITTCGLTLDDTVINIVSDCGGTVIACNDDGCLDFESNVIFSGTTGTAYYVRVTGYNGSVAAGQVSITQAGGGGNGGNDNCADATEVTSGLYDFDTTGASPDGAPTCAAASGTNDVWFKYLADADGTLVISTCDLAGHDTALAAFDGCGGAQIVCNDDSCGLQSTITVPVSAGSDTRILVTGYNGTVGAGQINVTFLPPCDLVRPSSAIDEQEPCQDDTTVDTNGGCNVDGFPVEQVSNNTYIWGTASTFIDPFTGFETRDTDWYEINHEGGLLTVKGQADFNLRLFVLDNVCPDATIIDTVATAGSCTEATLSLDLPAGTYRIFAGLDAFAGLPCGGANNYLLTIGEPSGCPSADFNGDEFVDFFDYDDFVACFENACGDNGLGADFNGDGFVDFFDYDDFVFAFEGCPQ